MGRLDVADITLLQITIANASESQLHQEPAHHTLATAVLCICCSIDVSQSADIICCSSTAEQS